MTLLVCLCLCSALGVAAEPEGGKYRVRVFWQSVPEAIEIAPALPFFGPSAPRLKLGDGREVWLRGPIHVAADGNGVLLGTRYPSRTERFEVAGAMRLRVPGRDWGSLSGLLRVWQHDGELEVEATLAREDYVKAVLAGEGGGIREPQALRALAVAIRSYAFANADRHKADGFHFCDTTHCQDLRLTGRNPALDQAVDATANELLWHTGTPVSAYHHADSGGHTESAQALWGRDAPAWMEGRPDPYSVSPSAITWSADLAASDVARALRAEGFPVQNGAGVSVVRRTRSGRVAILRVGGREMTAKDFRFSVGRQLGWNHVKSDLYEVTNEQGTVRFRGQGSGHGVGLSQRGADAMAKGGADYRKILAFYFPGTRVGVDAQGISWQMRRSERLLVFFVKGSEDAAFLPLVERQLSLLEEETGIRLRSDLTLRVYPSVELYRNSAGFGGETAAATRGREIHFQPLDTLRRSGSLAATIRHELAHALVLEAAEVELPEWFHEALARWLSRNDIQATGPATGKCRPAETLIELERTANSNDLEARQQAVRTADHLLEITVRRYGKGEVLRWARVGLPAENDQAFAGLLREACKH